MADQKGTEVHTLEQVLESDLESVDKAEEAVLQEAQHLGFDEDDLHKIGMSLRECMVNAVVHGNRYNARKKVHLSITKAPDRLTIVITDEGDGFDLSLIPDPLANENLLRQSGRGLLLMRAFVDEFQVRRGEANGTEVRMVKYLAKAS